jgi:hypothetical protein
VADRQLPVGDEVFLDHVGYFVDDLDIAGRHLERLGFAVSPVNLQQNADASGALKPSGTSNRLATLRRGFIEMLAATHDTPLADQLKQALARYTGLHLIALSHRDVPGQRARLNTAGLPMQEVVNLRRHVPMQGELREVRWSVLRPQSGVMPEGRVQYAYCHTPELTWPDDRPLPDNGADALSDILLCVADRRATAERFGRFAGRSSIQEGAFDIVPLDRGRLVFIEPRDAERLPRFRLPALPFMAGQALSSTDLPLTRAALAKAGIEPAFASDTLVCVAPDDALGSYLLFHDPTVRAPWAALAART